MTDFKDILRQLRIESGLTQAEAANALDISTTGFAGWEQGRTEPSISAIKKLCEFFEVSTDYLLGLEDESGAKEYGAPALPTVTRDELNALELYRKLTPRDRQRITTALEIYAEATDRDREDSKKA